MHPAGGLYRNLPVLASLNYDIEQNADTKPILTCCIMFDHGWSQTYRHSRSQCHPPLQIHISFQLINIYAARTATAKCRWVA